MQAQPGGANAGARMCWHQNARRGRSRTGAQARALHERLFGARKEGSLVHEREVVHERYIGA